MERPDRIDDAWEGVAARVTQGELPSEPDVARALEGAGALPDPRALERARAALDRFWDLVHDTPARALGLVTVAAVVADREGAPGPLRSELRGRQAAALFALGRPRDSSAALELALQVLAREPGADAALAARTRTTLLYYLGNARLASGEVRRSLVALEEAIALARAHRLEAELARNLSSLGNARLFAGEARAALEYYEDALRRSRAAGNREGEAVNHNNLGLARHALGDLDGALEAYQEALSISRQLGDRRSAGTIEANLALALADQGELELAQKHQEAALELARGADDRATQAVALLRLAALARERGALSEAQAQLEQAEALLSAMGDPRRTGAWIETGRLRLEVADAEAARALFVRALDLSREVGDRRGELVALRELGRTERLLQRLEESQARLREAHELARDLEDPDLAALVAIELAESLAHARQVVEARRLLASAEARATERGGSLLEAQHALAQASVARAAGERAQARHLLDRLVRAAREVGFVALQREATRRLAALEG